MGIKIKSGTGNSGSPKGVTGNIGQNYVVKDTPCLMPKENMKMFNAMQANAEHSMFSDYPSPYNNWWKGKH